jgi:hypothetical protein
MPANKSCAAVPMLETPPLNSKPVVSRAGMDQLANQSSLTSRAILLLSAAGRRRTGSLIAGIYEFTVSRRRQANGRPSAAGGVTDLPI